MASQVMKHIDAEGAPGYLLVPVKMGKEEETREKVREALNEEGLLIAKVEEEVQNGETTRYQ